MEYIPLQVALSFHIVYDGIRRRPSLLDAEAVFEKNELWRMGSALKRRYEDLDV